MSATYKFTVDGKHYITDKMNAIQQLHIAKRGAACLGALRGLLLNHAEEKELSAPEAAGLLASLLSMIPDEDLDFIIFRCLEKTRINMGHDTGWAELTASGRLMFEDMELDTVIKICTEVLRFNFMRFFDMLRPNSAAQSPE